MALKLRKLMLQTSFPGSSVDVALPFTVLQLFPASASRSMRKLEEEQAGLYKWAENLLDR